MLHPIQTAGPAGDTPPLTPPVHNSESTRRLEHQALAAQSHPGELMARAGLALAQLGRALAPHAQRVVVLVGPGNNGGDGLVAAILLHQAGLSVQAVLTGHTAQRPSDGLHAWHQSRSQGVPMVDAPLFLQQEARTPSEPDLIIDALLGLGQSRAPSGDLASLVDWANTRSASMRLAADQPTGLCADTGKAWSASVFRAHATLALLTLKPGLFTHQGRDLAGQVWLDDLGLSPTLAHSPASAYLTSANLARQIWPQRQHQQHKGSFGDLWVIGGAPGMEGAATLAAKAALNAGAGRVYLCRPGTHHSTADTAHPELMVRDASAWQAPGVVEAATVVCGCGGGTAIGVVLPEVLHRSGRLVLDADALNAISSSPELQQALQARAGQGLATVLTPHPLEAARLAGCPSTEIQADRLHWASALASRFAAVVLLKGSGTVIAPPEGTPWINVSGNARLATPGSGDVLAGWLGAGWGSTPTHHEAALLQATQAAAAAAWVHGAAANLRTPDSARPLTAGALIDAMGQVLDQWVSPPG